MNQLFTDDKYMLFQYMLTSGDITYAFTDIPWLTHAGDNMPT